MINATLSEPKIDRESYILAVNHHALAWRRYLGNTPMPFGYINLITLYI